MKLAAIYNVWDGVELLKNSMDCLKDHVDLFIIVWQDVSNYGENYNPLTEIDLSKFDNIVFIKFTPEIKSGRVNETKKRNIGIEAAKKYGCSHFLHLDCDEMYEDFGRAKDQYLKSGKNGSVCKIITYFKDPTLRFDKEENYYVPFIHQLRSDIVAGGRKYPYYVDPTRKINESDVILLDIYMHHFSWIRRNIERKIRNSSAKINIEKSNLLNDYHSAKEGSFIKDYNTNLISVPNIFNVSI